MRTEGKVVAIAQLCRWFGVPRSTFYYRGERRRTAELDRDLVELVGRLIAANPEYGLRRLTVLVRRELREAVNRKRIHRILKGNGWQIRQRPRGQRPRVQGWVSRVEQPNARWAIDATHVFCGRDGWCPLTAIIDCCDRTIVGWRLSRSGVAGGVGNFVFVSHTTEPERLGGQYGNGQERRSDRR